MAVISGDNGSVVFNNTPVTKKYVSGIEWKFNNASFGSQLIGRYVMAPDNYMGTQAGNTGLTFNPYTKQWVSALYVYATYAKLWGFSKSSLVPYQVSPAYTTITPTWEIDITPFIDHLQGIAFNINNGLYYAWGTKKGLPSADANRVLIAVNEAGVQGIVPWIPDFQAQAGMIAIWRDSIFFKPNNKSFFREYDIRNMALKREVTAYTQYEGFGVDQLTGNILIGGDQAGYREYTYNMGAVATYTTPVTGGEIEGVCRNRYNDTDGINADEQIHGGIVNGNCMWLLNSKDNYLKVIRFLLRTDWSLGTLGGDLKVSDDLLINTGTWESPVMDFGSYTDYLTNVPTATANGRTVTFDFRRSSTAPTTTVNNDFDIPVYSGWGSTTPSAYGAVASGRYQQLRMTII